MYGQAAQRPPRLAQSGHYVGRVPVLNDWFFCGLNVMHASNSSALKNAKQPVLTLEAQKIFKAGNLPRKILILWC